VEVDRIWSVCRVDLSGVAELVLEE
jgi:hypothetical protein